MRASFTDGVARDRRLPDAYGARPAKICEIIRRLCQRGNNSEAGVRYFGNSVALLGC